MSSEMTEEDGRVAILGIECQSFLNSQVGKYITTALESEAMNAMERFAFVDLEDRKLLAQLQADVRHWLVFAKLIDDAIQAGRAAESIA